MVASTEGGDVGDHFVSGGEPGPSSDVVLHDCVYSIKWVGGWRKAWCVYSGTLLQGHPELKTKTFPHIKSYSCMDFNPEKGHLTNFLGVLIL